MKPQLRSLMLPSAVLRHCLWLLLIVLFCLGGCKDTKSTTALGKLETCKVALDKAKWTDAITACKKVNTDEGQHLTAQAYMGRAGVSLIDLLTSMNGAGASVSSLFDAVPTTTATSQDIKSALDSMFLMKSPDQTAYLEGLLLSSLLIIKELQTLVGLKVDAAGNITHCASGGTIDGCSFKLSLSKVSYATLDLQGAVIPIDLTFSGLGTTLYNGLCGASAVDIHNTKVVTAYSNLQVPLSAPVSYYPIEITEKVTINKCAISTSSILYYNKLSATNLTSAVTALNKLNFYAKLDTGQNYSKVFSANMTTPATISLCNADAIPVTGASDLALNDCEVLYFLEHLNLN